MGYDFKNVVEHRETFMHWLDKYNMPIELIKTACSKTFTRINHKDVKSTVNYIDSILRNWWENGVKTLDDVKQLDKKYVSSKNKKNTSRFVNFEQRELDIETQRNLEKEIRSRELMEIGFKSNG